MRYKVLILVLGNYLPISKYIEDLDLPHEDAITHLLNGDLFDVNYHGGDEFKITAFGDELDTDVLVDNLKLDSKEDFNMLLNSIFSTNPCRVPSEDDVIGMYNNSGVDITLPEGIEDFDIEIKYNYLFKGTDIPDNIDFLYIFDNADVNLSTYNFIYYIVHKCMCDVELFTYHDEVEYQRIKDEELEENEVSFTVNKFDF